MESILETIKKLIGISKDYTHFDDDLIIHINSAFSALRQIGIGPQSGFIITGYDETWEDFIESEQAIPIVKSYIFFKTKFSFDPPTAGTTKESYEKMLSEYEWRLLVEKETFEKL